MKIVSYVIAVVLIAGLLIGVIIYTNNQQGKMDTPEGQAEIGQLILNEVMASNKSVFPDENGEYPDWIEVYNPGDTAIDLSNYGLSDDEQTYAKWVFPQVELPAKSYFVVYCSGKDNVDVSNQAYHANFKLSAAGEGVYLSSNAGALVDSVEYDSMDSNRSIGRNAEGDWEVMEYATPGFENTEAGYQAFQESMTVSDSPLKISEVMSSNKTTITDDMGAYSDWIEIYNSGDQAVSLNGYGLSDDPEDHLQWKFPDISIEPGEYLIVWASGDGNTPTENAKDALHTNFRLSSYAETVVLSNARGMVIDQVDTPTLDSDKSYARVVNDDGTLGEFEITAQPTPGFVNSESGYKEYEQTLTALASGDIMINEVMTGNTEYAQEEDGNYYDWIEIYNKGSQAVNLDGYGLTDNTGNPAKWTFSDVTIQPGEHLLVMASGLADNEDVKKKYIHTNYGIDAQGEIIALFDPDGNLLDRYNVPVLRAGLSMGRNEEAGQTVFFTDPTPGAQNAQGMQGTVEKPEFSQTGGMFDTGVTVEITDKDPDVTIYYTLDGSVPDTSDTQYTGAITIDSTKVLRARAYKSGYIESDVMTNTYIIGEHHTLDVVSVATEPAGLFDPTTGLYMPGPNAAEEFPQLGANWFKDTELPASFEMIEDGKTTYVQDLGLSMFGSYSRGLPQKSFALKSSTKYGSSRINYPVFGDEGFENYSFDSYKDIVLRSGGQDSNVSKVKEIPMVEVMAPYLDVQNYRPVVVYINGEYWGTYGIREKINKHYIAQHHDIENPDNICVLVANGSSSNGEDSEINRWGEADYDEMIEYMETHDLSDQEAFDHVASMMDVDNYMDFIIAQTYCSNSDAGNIKFWKERSEDGKWRWVLYDLDWSMMKAGRDGLAKWMNPDGVGVNNGFSTQIFRSLLQNEEWKQKFIERYAYHIKNTFSAEKMLPMLEQRAEEIRSEIEREREKFGGTVANWEANIEKTRYFIKNRPEVATYQVRQAFGLSAEETKELFGTEGRAPNEKELAEL